MDFYWNKFPNILIFFQFSGVTIPSITALRLPNFIRLLNSTHTKQQCIHSTGDRPLNFELFDRDHAFVWYSTSVQVEGAVLTIPVVKDHAYIFLNGKFMVKNFGFL